MKKILFLLKMSNTVYPDSGYPNINLSHATQLLCNYINNCTIKYVVDGNGIDREVSIHKPDIVILEAVWATPEKIKELQQLHPNVRFIIRLHSQLEFLATEGIMFDWLFRFTCEIASNHYETKQLLEQILNKTVLYLPNIYPKPDHFCGIKSPDKLNVSCFGSSRILKNQFNQAVAAIQYAELYNKDLIYHVNKSDTPVSRNIRALFNNSPFTLVEHEWMSTEDFLVLISTIDVGMQVSLTETFNVVTADHIWQGVPVVVSKQIDWLDSQIQDNYNVDDIIQELKRTVNNNPIENQIYNLILYNFDSKAIWDNFIQ